MSKKVYPYIPNSIPEIKREMLDYVGARDESDLYEEIPEYLRLKGLLDLPPAIGDELSIKKHINEILGKNKNCSDYVNFLGAGCAQHYSPAVCDELTSRGEFLTSYAGDAYSDHGKYQIFFEFQSMICELTGMAFTTMPCHDGAQAAASALCMANRLTGRKKVLLPKSMSPQVLGVIKNYLNSVHPENRLEMEFVGYDKDSGLIDLKDLKEKLNNEIAGVLIENPTFLGNIESQAVEIGKMVRENGSEYIVYADPITLGVMEAPANYGANIVIGDIHSLGLHLTAGGAHAGFITVPDDMKYMLETKELVYGITDTAVEGEFGFARALFERTHYAIREKGKEFTGTQSNLWTLPVCAYLSMMGPKGMEEVAETIMTNALYGARKLSEIPGVSLKFTAPFFKEFVVDFSKTGKTVAEINKMLLDKKIFGGLDLSCDYPELGQCALYCITEMNTKNEIDALAESIRAFVA